MIKNSYLLSLLSIVLMLSSCGAGAEQEAKEPTKPNIIYILADDLGYAELSCYGQTKIETPNIDKLAKEGIIFTQHYSGAPVCAPSRGVLMTGKHLGHSPVRGNDEWKERGDVWNYRAQLADSTLEGQKPLAAGTITLGTILQKEGYTTGCVGKWGLGAPNTDGRPLKQGFDFFCGYNCQRQAHTYYPVHLYKNDSRLYLDNDTIEPTRKLEKGADPYDMASYKNFRLKEYSGDVMFKELMGFVDDNSDKPFFMYWANPIPHAPLQAPQNWIDYYHKKFGDEEPYLGNNGYFPTRYPKATYAAMVSYFDEQVGLLVDRLKELGVYENTIIMFTSDNGPTYNGGTNSPWFDSAKPFASEYGFGKGFVYEGGIRVPMIASWPGKIAPGGKTDHASVFYDVMPTLCEIVGTDTPAGSDGISFLPVMLGKEQKAHDFLYWEFPSYGGQIAVRMGDWKVILKDALKKEPFYEVYNLKSDPTEEINIADAHPEIIQRAKEITAREHVKSVNPRWQMPILGD